MPQTLLRPITLHTLRAGRCVTCDHFYKVGDQVGRLVGIRGLVCMGCWYYFQLP